MEDRKTTGEELDGMLEIRGSESSEHQDDDSLRNLLEGMSDLQHEETPEEPDNMDREMYAEMFEAEEPAPRRILPWIIFGILIIGIAVAYAYITYIYQYDKADKQARSDAIEKEANPYRVELTRLQTELEAKKKAITWTSDQAKIMIGFALASADDADYISELAETFEFSPMAVIDCALVTVEDADGTETVGEDAEGERAEEEDVDETGSAGEDADGAGSVGEASDETGSAGEDADGAGSVGETADETDSVEEDAEGTESLAENIEIADISEVVELLNVAADQGWEIMLTATDFTDGTNTAICAVLSYMEENEIEESGIFLLRDDYATDENIALLLADGFLGYTVFHSETPRSGQNEDGSIYFEYYYAEQTSDAIVNKLSSMHQAEAAMIFCIDMEKVNNGTVRESFVKNFLTRAKAYVDQYSDCAWATVAEVVEELSSISEAEAQAMAEYEEYLEETEARIAELEDIIAEIYAMYGE